jgi:polysaccharide pyruvyl transferase WcaK-like protein
VKKVLLIGNFGAKNLGDELILAAALQKNKNAVVMTVDANFSQEFIGTNFQTIDFFPSGMRSFFRFFFKKQFRKNIFSLRKENFEKIIFPGGGLFAIKTRAVCLWTIVFLWAKYFLKKPIYFQSVGVDAKMSPFAQNLTKFVFRRADFVSARDEKSAQLLSKICNRKIENIGDAAKNFLKKKLLVENGILQKRKEKILFLNARAFFDFTKILNDQQFKNYSKFFVAFAPEDLVFAPKNVGIIFPKTISELITNFSSAEIAIGERLHFLIVANLFCGSEKVYTPQKPYSEKVENFCKEKGIGKI